MWDRQRLEQLVRDGVEENLSLEYKRADALGKTDAKKAEIVRDVSALANSSGGTLIYGIAEFGEKDQRHRPERIDPVDRREYPKEWLEQIIQSIQPRIEGVLVEPVDIGNLGCCYIVIVPQSHTAHQARDHVYYKRHNFNVLPMEDYELRDVINRRKHPKIHASIRASRGIGKDSYILVRLENVGTVLARDYMVDLQIPLDLGGYISVEQPVFVGDKDGKYYYSFRLGANRRVPLFPDSHVILQRQFSTNVTVRSPDGLELPSTDYAAVAIYADEMRPIKATINREQLLNDWVDLGIGT